MHGMVQASRLRVGRSKACGLRGRKVMGVGLLSAGLARKKESWQLGQRKLPGSEAVQACWACFGLAMGHEKKRPNGPWAWALSPKNTKNKKEIIKITQ